MKPEFLLFSEAPPKEVARRLSQATTEPPDFLSVNLTHDWFGRVDDSGFRLRYNTRGARGAAPQLEGILQPCEGGTLIRMTLDSRPAAFLAAMVFITPLAMIISWQLSGSMGDSPLPALMTFLITPALLLALLVTGMKATTTYSNQVLGVFTRTTGARQITQKPEEQSSSDFTSG